MEQTNFKGTTTIGLTCSDGVLFACDKRASWGTFVASKVAKKAFKINDIVGATVAGSVGDAISLMRLMQAEAALYEITTNDRMTPNAAAALMANILQGSRIFPYLVQVLVGGIERDKAKLYTLDPIGGLIEETYAASGSGSPMAYGVLEEHYSENKTVEENVPIIAKAIRSAMERDTATGDGITLVSITKDGYKEFSDKEVGEIFKRYRK